MSAPGDALRIGIATALAAGCTTTNASDRFRPPPDGVPVLASSYAVSVELLSTDCAPGGLAPSGADAVARVLQQGSRVARWVQEAAGATDSSWVLTGAVCVLDDGSAEVRLRGGRVGRERTGDVRCVVQAAVPAAHAHTPRLADTCADPAALVLVMDDAQVLRADLDVEILFGEGCARPDPCTLRLRWVATPLTWPPAVDGPDAGRADADRGT